MSLGPMIDVAIGLIFVYLLLSLITTAFQEIVASALKLRGRMLRDAIAGLLSDGGAPSALFRKVFNHPIVAGTAANPHPSYVPSRNFALAVIDTLSSGGNAPIFSQVEQQIGRIPNGFAKTALQALVRQAGGDLDALKTGLANWYDDAMDRLSGNYKRYSQLITIVCGAFLAVALNINSIHIAEVLWKNDALRAQVAAAAQSFSKNDGGHPDADAQKQFNSSLDQLFALDLPIGWIAKPQAANNATLAAPNASSKAADGKTPPLLPKTKPQPRDDNGVVQAWTAIWGYFGDLGWSGSLIVFLGWAMTALAVSLGAPFWFDTLQQILNLRGTGPKPPSAAKAAARK